MRLDGKAALVTGAGGGLGGATARRFAAEGASVLCTDRDLARAERTVADIELAGGTAVAFNCLLYTSPSPRDVEESRMPSSA